jgi:hypothetical protein
MKGYKEWQENCRYSHFLAALRNVFRRLFIGKIFMICRIMIVSNIQATQWVALYSSTAILSACSKK